jgi:hypothetical protein
LKMNDCKPSKKAARLLDAGSTLGAVLALAVLVLAVLVLAVPAASAHEPVFGLGPHTLYEGGFSTSLSYDHSVATDREDTNRASVGLTYGVTANLNLAVGVPYVIHQPTASGHIDGVGDPVVQVKWRPWTDFSPGNVDALSLIGAVKLPAGEQGISLGNTGYVLGATAARENLRYYLFGSVRYISQTNGLQGKPGNVFLYDASTGIRPFIMEYDEPDLVVLVEFNGRTVQGFVSREDAEAASRPQALTSDDAPTYRTRRQAHSGGTTTAVGGTGKGGTEFAVSPELLFSWGPMMVKGGVQFPFWDNFVDSSNRPDYRVKTDLIVQF